MAARSAPNGRLPLIFAMKCGLRVPRALPSSTILNALAAEYSVISVYRKITCHYNCDGK